MLTTIERVVPVTDAERLLIQLLGEGQISNRFLQELVEGIAGNTRETTGAVIAHTEREPGNRLSFTDASEFLRGKLDLNAALKEAVESHNRWGLQTSEYELLFTQVTVSEAGLKKVLESLEQGGGILPIFDPGAMTPVELFHALFVEREIPHFKHSRGFTELKRLRRLDPKDIPGLLGLVRKSCQEQQLSFEAAYKKAGPLLPTGPRLIFTPNIWKVAQTGVTATSYMQAMARGEISPLDPNADFLRYRAQIDSALLKVIERNNFEGMSLQDYRAALESAFKNGTIDEFMPDRTIRTFYPQYVFENGGVLYLDCLRKGRGMGVFYYLPAHDADDAGIRDSMA